MSASLPVRKKNKIVRCLVDADVAGAFAGRRLWLDGNGYVQFYDNGAMVHLHAYIVKAGRGNHVDHINNNRLDCRRSNLRDCPHWRNLHNLRKPSRARLGFYGVVARADQKGRFRAQINVRKAVRRCGSAWRSAVMASLVADGLRRQVVGGPGLTQNWPHVIPAGGVGAFLYAHQGHEATIHYAERGSGALRSVTVVLGPKAYESADFSRLLAVEVGGRRYRVSRLD